MSYLVLSDGTIQVTTEQEALAIRAHLLAATPDLAALQTQIRELRGMLIACQDELGGAAPEALPGLIRKLRLMEPNDQLRIERNYWRARSMELGEECIIWQRRAGRDAQPSTEVFADLAAKVKAAASLYADQLAAAKAPRAAEVAPPEPRRAPGPPPAIIHAESVSQAGAAAQEPDRVPPRVELRQIRERLGLSQRELGAALGQTQARISLMERGSVRVPPELLSAARAHEVHIKMRGTLAQDAKTAGPQGPSPSGGETPAAVAQQTVEPENQPAVDSSQDQRPRDLSISDADLDELADLDHADAGTCPGPSEAPHADGVDP